MSGWYDTLLTLIVGGLLLWVFIIGYIAAEMRALAKGGYNG